MQEILKRALRQIPFRPPARVLVAMSGGVDSSVAAALMHHAGYEVYGVMLKLWSEPGREHENRCCTLGAQVLARQVAHKLGIPFEVLDVREAFYRTVVQAFLEGYRAGRTPNPCLVCNRELRWQVLLAYAERIGARALVTGHHARILFTPEGPWLLRGRDRAKDQSYVLSWLRRSQLARTFLPIGELTKAEVRQLAETWHLPVAHRPDSQDLCFVGGDYRGFLRRQAPDTVQPGPIVTPEGQVVGTHEGLAFYTIGQRRGLGVAAARRLYVVDKDPARNLLVVGPEQARYRRGLRAVQAHWLTPEPPKETFEAEVQIRYTTRARPARIVPRADGTFEVWFQEPMADITPGQAAVVYQGDRVLGMGIIERAL